MRQPLLQIIIGSTRPGRVGPSVAEWITAAAAAHGHFAVHSRPQSNGLTTRFVAREHSRFSQASIQRP